MQSASNTYLLFYATKPKILYFFFMQEVKKTKKKQEKEKHPRQLSPSETSSYPIRQEEGRRGTRSSRGSGTKDEVSSLKDPTHTHIYTVQFIIYLFFFSNILLKYCKSITLLQWSKFWELIILHEGYVSKFMLIVLFSTCKKCRMGYINSSIRGIGVKPLEMCR